MPLHSKKVFFADYVFDVGTKVYEPAEDSFFFAENMRVKRDEYVLDMGTGCGILSVVAAEKASRVVAIDINPYAIRYAKENAEANVVEDKLSFVQGDLFTPLRSREQFDLIIFNAPYLPEEPFESSSWLERAWNGGKTGRQVIDRFVLNTSEHLKEAGRVLLMLSTVTGIDATLLKFREGGFNVKVAAKFELPFFETLALLEAKHCRS
ncbi:class I SAM-dependent methyltransferase [Candidatus Bathyarchaeota archaeon]|jgi:release factor glutamine methyltransferase|nr:class I SAM-dependent methyltransferase [Candidatus Bathyarchaeota archaeon]